MKRRSQTSASGALRIALVQTSLVFAAAASTVSAGVAFAQSAESRSYDIPAAPLNLALRSFASQSGLQIGYQTSVATSATAPAVKGVMTAEQALTSILSQSGLRYSFSGGGGVTILGWGSSASDTVNSADGATLLSPIVVSGQAGTSTAPMDGYRATVASAGSKTDTPIVETPQSVSVITADQMRSQRVASLAESLSYTPGISTQSAGFSRLVDDFMIRGFNAANGNTGTLRDGMKLQSNVYDGGQEPYGLERVEVLRGASSMLYGQLAPGGVVNAISKRPADETLREVNVEYGSYDRKQVSADFGGPVTEDGVLTYRLTGVLRDADSWVDETPDDKVYIAPALKWQPEGGTSLTLLGSYQHVNTLFSAPYLLDDIQSGALSRDTFTGIDGFDQYKSDTYTAGGLFEHEFDDGVKLRSGLRYFRSDLDWKYMMSNLLDMSSLGGSMARLASVRQESSYGITADTSLEYQFDAFGAEHTVLGGVDFYRRSYDSHRYRGGTYSILDISTGSYTGSPSVNYSVDRGSDSLGDQFGVYVQDQIKFDDHWVLLLGGRHDWSSSDTTSYQTGALTEQSDTASTGRAGLVYLFDNGLAPYVSLSQSFLPQVGTDSLTGDALKPNEGLQYEVGLRYQPVGTDLLFSAALYDLTQTNVVTYDSSGLSYQQGKVHSRGLELETRGEVGLLGLVLSYAYTDAEIVESALSDEVGEQVALVPHHSVSAWADYGLDDLGLEGVRIGAGIRYVGKTNLTDSTTDVPGYALVDAMAKVDLGKFDPELDGLDLKLNARNLFNKTFYTCASSDGCRFGEPLTVSATLSYRW